MIAFGLLLLSIGAFVQKRLLRYLRYLQQEEYDIHRFLNWIWRYRALDKRGSLVLLLVGTLAYIGLSSAWANTLAAFLLIGITLLEKDPRTTGKLTLKMTERATRVYHTALTLAIGALLLLTILTETSSWPLWLLLALFVQLPPLFLITSCLLLQPGEKKRQQILIQEAQKLFSEVSPYVIGITGSYGKTSTKDALSQLLQVTLGPTFWPKKGINTPMGITREIRTRLRKGFKYAVIEMGAYGEGSIRRLCALTPPHAAIITYVGTAHLERFGSEEAILRAKSELAQAATDLLVCNGDNVGARQIAQHYPKKTTLLYGFNQTDQHPLDCWISAWSSTTTGTTFTLHWKGKCYQGVTPLMGKPALSNAVAAFTIACALGSQPEYVIAAMAHLSPVDNRLQLEKVGAITYLHDAYNSNPVGFAAGLDLMTSLPGKRRILMTPGMIELGEQQASENERLGRQAAQTCDLALIVGELNRPALEKGLLSGGMSDKNIVFCPTREIALAKLRDLKNEGDLILIENDLGDLHEAIEEF